MAEKKSKLAEIKTKPTVVSVVDFINTIEDEQKRNDSFTLVEMMKKASGEEPVLWGSSIIGFGNKRYKSERSGREVDWFLIGFAPRKANLSLYLSVGIEDRTAILEQLGKHKTDGGCIYVKKLTDVNLDVLEGMIDSALVKNQNMGNG
ncbi:DUF1801 domain-containing protein [Fluviicola sp.]|uniref:DUF1801 domain-containing protein n=1 Tax=Fluviicola sp. TaxID=1917219 RepID=UPI003D2A75F3